MENLATIQNKDNKFLGKKFGRLLVLERDWNKTSEKNNWKKYFKCRCDCGNIRSIRSEHLRMDGDKYHTESCGCLQKEKASKNGKLKKLPNGEYPRRCLYSAYKLRTQRRGLVFNLTRDKFDELISQECFYCNDKPKNKYKNNRYPDDFILYNGIDRQNSLKGYEIENVVTCCAQCNYAKLDENLNDFISWIDRIYTNLKKKNLL